MGDDVFLSSDPYLRRESHPLGRKVFEFEHQFNQTFNRQPADSATNQRVSEEDSYLHQTRKINRDHRSCSEITM